MVVIDNSSLVVEKDCTASVTYYMIVHCVHFLRQLAVIYSSMSKRLAKVKDLSNLRLAKGHYTLLTIKIGSRLRDRHLGTTYASFFIVDLKSNLGHFIFSQIKSLATWRQCALNSLIIVKLSLW